MLLNGPGGQARRFQITWRHVMAALGLWLLAMLLFFYLGFRSGDLVEGRGTAHEQTVEGRGTAHEQTVEGRGTAHEQTVEGRASVPE